MDHYDHYDQRLNQLIRTNKVRLDTQTTVHSDYFKQLLSDLDKMKQCQGY